MKIEKKIEKHDHKNLIADSEIIFVKIDLGNYFSLAMAVLVTLKS